MSKCKIQSFVPEAPLAVMSPEERQLLVRLALARQLRTACLAEGLEPLGLPRQAACPMARLKPSSWPRERTRAFRLAGAVSECKEVPVVSQIAATIAGSARKEVLLMAADVCTKRVAPLSEALDNFVKPPSTPTHILPHLTSPQTP